MSDSRRYALVLVSDQALHEVFTCLGVCPEGGDIFDIEWDASRRCWFAVVKHASFEPVIEGCALPTFQPACVDSETLPNRLEVWAAKLREARKR